MYIYIRGWSRLDSAETRRDFLGRDRCLVSAPSVSEHFGIFCHHFLTANHDEEQFVSAATSDFISTIPISHHNKTPFDTVGCVHRTCSLEFDYFFDKFNSLSSSILKSWSMLSPMPMQLLLPAGTNRWNRRVTKTMMSNAKSENHRNPRATKKIGMTNAFANIGRVIVRCVVTKTQAVEKVCNPYEWST